MGADLLNYRSKFATSLTQMLWRTPSLSLCSMQKIPRATFPLLSRHLCNTMTALLQPHGRTWQNKSFRLVLFGDYEFQTTVYGLSGLAGVHPCLHCLSTKQQIQQCPADWEQQPEPRTLDTLSLHHGQFMADGGRLSKAKHFYNAIRPAMLSVPIDHVCLPALHLDLGIYLWVFETPLSRSVDTLI
eukprot:scpid38678/ scgid9643/ 